MPAILYFSAAENGVTANFHVDAYADFSYNIK